MAAFMCGLSKELSPKGWSREVVESTFYDLVVAKIDWNKWPNLRLTLNDNDTYVITSHIEIAGIITNSKLTIKTIKSKLRLEREEAFNTINII